MKRIATILTIFIITFSITGFSANFYWVSNTNSNWNNPANWSATNGGAGGAGVPGNADFVYFNNNGTGNCIVDINVTIEGISINGYTGTIDLNGNNFSISGASNCTFNSGTIDDTPGTGNLSSSTTGRITFSGTTFNAALNITANRLRFNGSIFNNNSSFTKTGSTNHDYSVGGNTFNGSVTLTNASGRDLYLAQNNPDIFNNSLALVLNGTGGDIFLANSAAGNQFNGNITINYISADNVYIGRNSGTSTLATGYTISVIGFGASGTGNLYLEEFTQNGSTLQSISLNTNGRLEIGPNTTFNADFSASAPKIVFYNSTFNGNTTLIKTGTGNNTSNGGNVFNGVTQIENAGSGYMALGGVNGDTFNNDVTFTSSGTNSLYVSRNGNSTFNGNITINSTGTSQGVRFGQSGGISTLASGNTISVGSPGFSSGDLSLTNFIQLGNTPQNLTLTGSARIILNNTEWNGNVTFTAPRITTRDSEFKGTAYLEKSGTQNDYSAGGNKFYSDAQIVLSDSGTFAMGNGTADSCLSNLTLTHNGYGRYIIWANNSLNNFISGNLTLDNNSYGSQGHIYVSNNTNSSIVINGSCTINQNSTANTSYAYFGNNGNLILNSDLTVINNSNNPTSRIYVATNSGASLTINGNVSITNNNNITNDSRIYFGNQGDITLNGNLFVTNNSGANNSGIYMNTGANSSNTYNGNIVVESTNNNCDGVYFGYNSGSGTLTAGNTITIGSGGFISGYLYFRNFTQVGNTAHSLTLTGTGYLYNYDSNWGGDITFTAPRINTRGTTYNRTAYLEKTGATNDYCAGGNTFAMDVTFQNSSPAALYLGNGTFDTFSANVTLNNVGTSNMGIAHNGAGHSISGDLTLNNSASGSNTYIYVCNSNTSTLSVGGNLIANQTGNATTNRITLGNSGDITLSGNLIITNAGSGTNSQIWLANQSSSTITINGNTTVNNNSTASNYSEIYLGQSGDVTFNGTLTLTNNSTATYSTIHLNRYSNSTNTYNGNIEVNSINASSDGIRFGQNYGKGILSAGRTITIGSGGFIAGDLYFRNFKQQGATPQTLTLTGTSRLIYREQSVFDGDMTATAPNVYFNGSTFNGVSSFTKTANTVNDSRGGNRFNNTTTITNNSTSRLRLSGTTNYPDTFYADVNFINTAGGTMQIAYRNTNIFTGNVNINNSSTLNFGRNTGVALFAGANAQSINDLSSSPNLNIYRLEINKSSNNLTLNMPVDINTQLTLINGNIITTSTNILTMYNNSTVGAVSNASYVDGPMIKRGNDAFTFPVGNNGFYAPIAISAPSSGSAEFLAQYFNVDPNTSGYNTNQKDLSLDHVSICEYWILNRVATTNNVNVTLSWDSRSCGVTNLAELAVARWDGSMWRDHGNGGTTGTTTSGTVVTSAPVTNFSPFTLASVTSNNPLPIELISFDAIINGTQVDLKWVTASEINNDYFVVEKSKDGENWEEVVWTDGAGNSNYTMEYYEVDENPYEGISYYRLKQVDFDGKFTYSNIVPVAFEHDIKKDITILPNPVKKGESIYVEINGFKGDNVVLVLRDIQGKEFYTKAQIVESNYQLKAIKLDNNIPAGTYLIVASSNNGVVTKRIIIE